MPYKTYDDNPFDDYQGYDEGGSDIERLMNKLIGQQKKIQSTITDSVEKTQTQITQTADEIRLEVSDADDDLQSQITQNAGEIDIRVKNDDVISSINLSPETIQIESENINLVGAVTVLSDITGELGTITAGAINGVQINSANIDISENIYVGQSVYLLSGYDNRFDEKFIYFNSGDSSNTSHIVGTYLKLDLVCENTINIISNTIDLEGGVRHNTGSFRFNSESPIQSVEETGFCGTGSRDTDKVSGAIVSGVGVNFKVNKSYTPSGISFTALSNTVGIKHTERTSRGFWIYVESDGSNDFPLWRGYYTC